MEIVAIIGVLLKLFLEVFGWFKNASKTEREDFLIKIPDMMKGITDANKLASKTKDPSIIASSINRKR